MGDSFGQGHTPQSQFASGLPQWNGGLGKVRGREVMCQNLGFDRPNVRKPLLDHTGDLGVQLLLSTLEQRVVSCVLN